MNKNTNKILAAAIVCSVCVMPRAQAASFWNTAPTSGSAASASSGGDCDQSVQTAQSQMQQVAVASQISLASNIITPASDSISGLSCLDNLLSGSLDIIFNPPSLSAIVDTIINAVCNVARNEINSEINSVASQFSTGSLGSAGGLGIPGLSSILPGIDLGSVTGGLGVSYGGYGGSIGSTSGAGSLSTRYNVRDSFPGIDTATGVVNSGAGYVRGLVQ